MESKINLLDWRSYPIVVQRIETHTPKGWMPLTVHLVKGDKEYFKWKNEIFLEVVFKVKGKSELWRSSFRVRGMSHLLSKGNENDKEEKDETSTHKGIKGSYLTSSDILGEERVP